MCHTKEVFKGISGRIAMIAEAYREDVLYPKTCPIHNVQYVAECHLCYKEGKEAPTEGLKYDDGKLLMTLVQPSFVKGVAEVLTFGAKKYKPNSWQTVEDAKRRYEDALYRHWLAYLDGEQVDSESGLEHLKHLACNAMFLLHLNKTKGN